MRAYENEPVVIKRDVEAIMVPGGQPITLKLGLAGYITQALGGSFTLYVEGNLYRLAGDQADAIGKEIVRPPELPPNSTEDDVRGLAWQQMRSCYDPEIPINIVDLGLVYACDVSVNAEQKRDIHVTMTLTAPGCGMGDVLVQDVRDKLESIPTVGHVEVNLTFDPPWTQTMMSDAAKLQTGMMW
jgi:probable FeS assembly SUF system protein SufT